MSRTSATRTRDESPGYFRRIPIFIREVVAELQKVIWPTRKELLTYTSVVVVFVAIMMTIVGLLDLGFAKACCSCSAATAQWDVRPASRRSTPSLAPAGAYGSEASSVRARRDRSEQDETAQRGGARARAR